MIVIHTNDYIPHQVTECTALLAGFKRHAQKAVRSSETTANNADINVVLGPYYALRQNQGRPQVLFVDRGYYDSPNSNSIHWVNNECEKIWLEAPTGDRFKPELRPEKEGRRCVVILDHRVVDNMPNRKSMISQARKEYGHVDIRPHPQESREMETLEDCLDRHDVVFGQRSTALVTAAIAGLRIKTLDTYSPTYPLTQDKTRDEWLHNLSWHNWTLDEMESGNAWEYYRDKM